MTAMQTDFSESLDAPADVSVGRPSHLRTRAAALRAAFSPPAMGERPSQDWLESLGVAETLVATLAAHSPLVAAHAWHVAALAGQVAARIGLDAEAQRRTWLAGLVHDIGKVAVPASILEHAGALDDEGWRIMRRHPEIGAEMIAEMPLLAHLAPAVLHHHEAIDGSGYPGGLTGFDIPLESRIIAVADTWSALTSHRPYRPAVPAAQALERMLAAVGTQLDAHVVDAFVDLVRPGAARA